jgi:hypothetical protein
MSGAHHRGPFKRRAERVRTAAYSADALASMGVGKPAHCWRCGRTLAEHPPHRNGRPAEWTAGHTTDGDPNCLLLPEASTCNYVEGGKRKHQLAKARRFRTSRDW